MISKAKWQKYVDRLAAIDDRAAAEMERYIDANGLTDDKALIDYAYALATKYGEASAELACEMYDLMAQTQGANVPPAVPAETATIGEVAKNVGWAKYHSPGQIPSKVGRFVRQAGADTMLQNAERDGVQWAWVPSGGETCAFCIALASRGWQDASDAVKRGRHASHIHANCDCTFAIAHNEKAKRDYDYIYDPDRYKEMYYGAEGNTPAEKINSLRRIRYQQNREYINAQKRDAYQAKKTEANKPSAFFGANGAFTQTIDGYYGLPESMKDLPKIQGNPKLQELINAVNPYTGERENCVSCTTAFALRLQGIDAISIPFDRNQTSVISHPWILWNLPQPPKAVIYHQLKSSIENDMKAWGDGAICQIPLTLEYGNVMRGHMITAFQFGGQTYYFDPQLKIMDASFYFNYLMKMDPQTSLPAGYFYYRVDGVELSEQGRKMVKYNNANVQ